MNKKKIFITGSNSFIGKNLVRHFGSKFDFYGIDRVEVASPKIEKVNLCSTDLAKFLKKDTDVIVNLAAVSNSKSCDKDPLNCYQTNVVGLINLLECANKRKIKNIIHASTEWVYEENEKFHQEDERIDLTKINSHYAFSKLMNEQILRIYHKQNPNINITCLRFGIIYGKRKKNWSAFESIINNVMTSSLVSVGSLKTGRHFINVNDVATAIIKSFNNSGFNIFNIQGRDFVTLKMLIDKSSSYLNKRVEINELEGNKPSVRKMSLSKSKKEMKYEAKISYEKGVEEIIEYLKNAK